MRAKKNKTFVARKTISISLFLVLLSGLFSGILSLPVRAFTTYDISYGRLLCCSMSESGQLMESESPCVNEDGRYVAFSESDSGRVLRKDMESGEVQCCSSSASGVETRGWRPAINPDGRYLVFCSMSEDLVAGYGTGEEAQVFLKDMKTGDIGCCSTSSGGIEAEYGCDNCEVSADGRYVVFDTDSGNLGEPEYRKYDSDVFRKDTITGEIICCSDSDYLYDAFDPALAGNGRYVFFSAHSVYDEENGEFTCQIYRKDCVSGEIICLSDTLSGGEDWNFEPDVTPDGEYLVFVHNSEESCYTDDVYRRDMETGDFVCCSNDKNGDVWGISPYEPSISDNGRYVAFRDYGQPDYILNNHFEEVYRKDLETEELIRCSVNNLGQTGNDWYYRHNRNPMISGDGKYVVFDSDNHNFVPGESKDARYAYRKEIEEKHEFYFAEGYTGDGFQEYVLLGNKTRRDREVDVTYTFADGTSRVTECVVAAMSRCTIDVNKEVGEDREVSVKIVSPTAGISAERCMYFAYRGKWRGGHACGGSSHPDCTFLFAEGAVRENFDQYFCIQNPNGYDAGVTLTHHSDDGGVLEQKVVVKAMSRKTVRPVGGERHISTVVRSSLPVVVERPMYFDYGGLRGGHVTAGQNYAKSSFGFLESTTREGYDEYICLMGLSGFGDHFSDKMAVEMWVWYSDGTYEEFDVGIFPIGSRVTIKLSDYIESDRDFYVGVGCGDVAGVAERVMYFDHKGMKGGHANVPAGKYSKCILLAEGTTREGFDQYLCFLGAHSETEADLVYLIDGEEAVEQKIFFEPHSRVTVRPVDVIGECKDFSLWVRGGYPTRVERVVYFGTDKWNGGHCSSGQPF